jgi:hypothetical protein
MHTIVDSIIVLVDHMKPDAAVKFNSSRIAFANPQMDCRNVQLSKPGRKSVDQFPPQSTPLAHWQEIDMQVGRIGGRLFALLTTFMDMTYYPGIR